MRRYEFWRYEHEGDYTPAAYSYIEERPGGLWQYGFRSCVKYDRIKPQFEDQPQFGLRTFESALYDALQDMGVVFGPGEVRDGD